MFRLALLAVVAVPCAFSQALPAFQWIQQVDGSGSDQVIGLGTDAAGNVYIAGNTNSTDFPVKSAFQNQLRAKTGTNVFVTKLDANGNIVYSTYFGGTGSDSASAMAVDASGNVFVTGSTASIDFPTTSGGYSTAAKQSFVFRLNPDGSLGYSTYLFAGRSTPTAIAVDASGAAYLSGTTTGNLPVTPGVYQPSLSGPGGCVLTPAGEECYPPYDAFLTKLDPGGATLIFSTYVGEAVLIGQNPTVAFAGDGSAYVSISNDFFGETYGSAVFHVNPTGSALLGSVPADGILAMAVGGDGNLYTAGTTGIGPTGSFVLPGNGFQPSPVPAPFLYVYSSPGVACCSIPGGYYYAFVAKVNPQLTQTLSATLLGGFYGSAASSLSFDAAGNVVVGGWTAPEGFPTRMPLANSFGPVSGFVAELDSGLSNLLFSTYLGDAEPFAVQGVAVSAGGGILIDGTTQAPLNFFSRPLPFPSHVFVNKLSPGGALALRIDSILNAASLLSVPLSAGETILVRGAGFGSDAKLSIGGVSLPVLSVSSTSITAVVPASIPLGVALIQVQSGGETSNIVEAPVAAFTPGLFSADGTGYGQGYILNVDGSMNTPSNPAHPGDAITIFATGVGPVSFNGPYAVAEIPFVSFIGGAYATGDYAVFGLVAGFPGSVYQLTINVPSAEAMGYGLPQQVAVMLQFNGVVSQSGLALSVAQ